MYYNILRLGITGGQGVTAFFNEVDKNQFAHERRQAWIRDTRDTTPHPGRHHTHVSSEQQTDR